LGDSSSEAAVASCTTKGIAHAVTIESNVVSPQHTDAALCDTLTIVSMDNRIRLIAFGTHDDHQPYDGVSEKTLEKNQSFTVTLDQAGTFTFHDHLEESVEGTFTVSAQPAS
jgi:plastocyanin